MPATALSLPLSTLLQTSLLAARPSARFYLVASDFPITGSSCFARDATFLADAPHPTLRGCTQSRSLEMKTRADHQDERTSQKKSKPFCHECRLRAVCFSLICSFFISFFGSSFIDNNNKPALLARFGISRRGQLALHRD